MPRRKPILITHDDRERTPWNTKLFGPGFEFTSERMETGDYTIKGMEDIVRIERKNGWGELACNIASKKYRTMFVKLLRRMAKFPVRMLVIEADVGRLGATDLRSDNVTTQVMLNWVINIPLEYGVTIIPIGSRQKGRYILPELFRRIVQFNKNGRLFYHHIGDVDGEEEEEG